MTKNIFSAPGDKPKKVRFDQPGIELLPVCDRFAGHALPSSIYTDFLIIPASLSVAESLAIIRIRNKRAVVIHRQVKGTPLHHLFLCLAIEHALRNKNPDEVIEAALNLHEIGGTPVLSAALAKKQLREGSAVHQPTVIIDDGNVVGYFGLTQYLAAGKKITPGLKEKKSDPIDWKPITTEIKIKTGGTGESLSFGKHGGALPSDHSFKDIKIDRPVIETTLDKYDCKKKITRRGRSFSGRIDDVLIQKDIRIEAASASPAIEAPCHFAAQMPEDVEIGKIQQVQATISRDVIEHVTDMISDTGIVMLPASPDQTVTVRLVPKKNFTVIGDFRADVKVPQPGTPAVTLFFEVKPTSPGDGELWIAFCQGPVSLVTLKLKPQIVAEQSIAGTEALQAETSVTMPAYVPAWVNTLWVYLEDNNGKKRYRYSLLCNSIGVDQEYESPEFSPDMMTVMKPYTAFFDEVDVGTKADFNQLQLQLRSIGARLFQTLFPRDLQSVFWENRDKIRHLKLYCEEPYIPWEMLHVCEPGKPLPAETKFLGQMGLVRWLHGHAAPVRLRVRPGRAWYVTPSYPGNELESAKQEGKLLKSLFDAKPVKPATRPEVTKLLSAEGPFDLFHFAGHGEASEEQITDCRIELEPAGPNASSMLRDLTPDIISGLCQLKAEDGTRPIIVINSCQTGKTGHYITGISGFAPAFLEREAGVFVGALWKIGDRPALTFIKAFYEALHAGKTVAEAANIGREKAYASGDVTYLAYVVYADPFAHLVQ